LSFLVENGGGELRRERAVAGDLRVVLGQSQRAADLRLDHVAGARSRRGKLRHRPDQIPLGIDAEQRGGHPQAQAFRDAPRPVVDHVEVEAVLGRVGLRLRPARSDRHADDVEVVLAAQLRDSRDRVADRHGLLARGIEEVHDEPFADPGRDVEPLIVERPAGECGQRALVARGLLRGFVRRGGRRVGGGVVAAARERGPDCEQRANKGPHPCHDAPQSSAGPRASERN
jgi:hypothetical protein